MWPTLLAVLHLTFVPLGVGALAMRAKALSHLRNLTDLSRLLFWDNIYGVLAVFWLASGIYRAFGGTEKGSGYYLANHVFWLKMLLLLGLLVVETRPMVQFVRWRTPRGRSGFEITESVRQRLLRAHYVEFTFIVGMVVCAASMARGLGVVP